MDGSLFFHNNRICLNCALVILKLALFSRDVKPLSSAGEKFRYYFKSELIPVYNVAHML